ncbi:MAG: DNA starvation/stationary phase protection protein [Fusobacterium gastrosuis]|uniref:Dps family protein n=1 Tax=Fusobacterium TaxID=848 RepID=UPI0025C048C3|nr:DNA starvation/stationary phase protection protein [Fusobacterium sp.]MDD7410420.1 DNA starvation/stationary phase protection protein [Fusobacteriaceae bacterium]MDY4011662.1 DNA starvation/stationary phase protection protein [Fusobacterium gastrosuis]MCI7223755.1 DNA starvation/stationary phase protection protein [Fusobacterium sp.]MDY5305426.1 DNA starvation/stationary phase protection protein [Fusobacterium gastrosuis]MDY5712756.1 DNA starvation/stationary phase protection protein [Fusob
MKNLQNLNKYLSNLAVLITKTHNYHWNVVGLQFTSIHNFTEELYDYYFGKYDDVAEIIKMRGHYPLVKLSDYLANATVKEVDAKDFSTKEVLDSIKADMELMLADARIIREVANEEDDFGIVSEMEDQIGHFTKQLWFINSILK